MAGQTVSEQMADLYAKLGEIRGSVMSRFDTDCREEVADLAGEVGTLARIVSDMAAGQDRLAALEAEVFCVVNVSEYGHVGDTGCGHSENYVDWSDKERCPHCGRKLIGHDNVKPID